MPWNSGLQGTALNIASYPGTPLRIVAGPGTGKTFALMRRVARLLEQEGVPPDRILAVTFTRTAANGLVEQDWPPLGYPARIKWLRRRCMPSLSVYLAEVLSFRLLAAHRAR